MHELRSTGNGKRSDPNMNSESRIEPTLFDRVLVSDADRLSQILQLPIIAADPLVENDNAAQQRSMALSPDEYNDDDTNERYNNQFTRNVPDVTDLRRYIRALKLQHAMRNKEADLE